MIRFAEPIYLWLLVLVPVAWMLSRRLKLIAPGRRYTIIVIRTLLLLCVIFGLSRIEWRKTSRDLSVFLLLDQSESIPTERRQDQIDIVEEITRRAGARDQTGMIVFGSRPSIETSPVSGYEYISPIQSVVEGQRTDVASAIRLALAAFPANSMKRIVLMSDGNENLGSALDIARISKNTGVPIDTIPMRYDARNDVQIEKIVVPERTSKDAPFDIKVFLESQQETQGTLRVFEDGDLIIEQPVTVRPGRNAPLVMSRRLRDGGFHTYTATIEAPGDLRPQNNKAHGFTFLKAEPRVLLVEGGEMRDARYLAGALEVENIIVEMGTSADLPTSLDEIQRYDSVILSNVPASDMSVAQMRLIERAVHDLGIGLVMIGGENAFGAGGYIDTPVELALPVSMDIKQKKMLPNGALVVVLHTCEIPSGNAWAREISLASLNVLSSQDYFGLVYFGYGQGFGTGYGETWLWEPGVQMVGDKKAMRTQIKGVQPGDAPAFDPFLRMAAEELSQVKAQTKHVVVISDGDPSPPSKATVQKIRDDGITVSGVAIAPHSGMTVDTLKEMAYWGAGNFYYPSDSSELPRIFTKEATIVRKSLIREDSFVPISSMPSEMLLGFSGFPQLDGYVVTSLKDLATEALMTEWDDPLLAHWRYGLGKSAAFTSDAKDKWATAWVSWGSFSKFWSQAVRWSLRETNSSDFQVHTEIEGGTGKVTIDAVDETGNFKNFINFNTTVIGPDFEPTPVDVRQVAPGRYEGNFPANKVGTYMLSAIAEGEENEEAEPQFLTSGVALSYSPEYETSTSADEFLKKISNASGGKFIDSTPAQYNPYTRDLAPARKPAPMWPYLLLLAAMLMPADVFVRRVFLDWAAVAAWVSTKFLGIMPRRDKKEQYTERMESLRAAKSRALRDKDEEKSEREAREEFRKRLDEKKSTMQPTGSIFDKQEDADARPSPRRGKQTYSADEPERKQPPQQSGMSSLMEAKKRAQKKTRRQDDGGKEKQ